MGFSRWVSTSEELSRGLFYRCNRSQITLKHAFTAYMIQEIRKAIFLTENDSSIWHAILISQQPLRTSWRGVWNTPHQQLHLGSLWNVLYITWFKQHIFSRLFHVLVSRKIRTTSASIVTKWREYTYDLEVSHAILRPQILVLAGIWDNFPVNVVAIISNHWKIQK